MKIELSYGKNGLEINLPDNREITVIQPTFVNEIHDPTAALRNALRNPNGLPALQEIVGEKDCVGIVFSDITRPTPNNLILPQIFAELNHIPIENITLFNALGTHRSNTDVELRSMLGDDLVERYRIVQNNAFDKSTQIHMGRSSCNHEIWLNKELLDCKIKILTGFIEPHFFAGFSGGGKAIMPGMAGQETVLGNHDATMISNPNASWGITHGNPIWEEIQEIACQVGQIFLLNVTLNKNKQITGVFSGELMAAHVAGCEFVRKTAMLPVSHSFDIVITTNSGYPQDLNLYQSVKGMSAAAKVVKQGGSIIIATDCWDGIPEHGLYGQLLRDVSSPKELLNRINEPGFLKQDQWQAQIQAQIQLKADVYVYSNNLSDEQIRNALLIPCRSIEDTVISLLEKYGKNASICVLPEGPQSVPFVKSEV
jgi:lactate racemase